MLCIIGGSDAISCILELSYMISTNCRAGSLADLPLVVKLIHQLNQPLYITNYNIRQNTCSWVEALAFCFDRNHSRCYSLPGIMCSAPICLFPPNSANSQRERSYSSTDSFSLWGERIDVFKFRQSVSSFTPTL